MKLTLSGKEVTAILLEWAQNKWPSSFNTVEVEARYGDLNSVSFYKSESEPEKVIEEAE